MLQRYTKRTFVLEIVMMGTALVWAVPAYLLVNYSFRATDDQASPLALPTTFTFDNYFEAWREAGLGSALINTVIITVASLFFIVIFATLAAYPLARGTRMWSTAAFYFFMLGLLLPPQLALIPLYSTMLDLGLLGTRSALVIFYTGLMMPFSIFLYTNFLRAVPLAYEEAASIDGASSFQTLWKVIFPLLRPVTGTVVILDAIFIWNDFLTPLLWLSGSGEETIAVAVFSFAGQYVTWWNLIFAGLVISIAPILITYFALQRTVIKGFATGVHG